MATDGEEKRLEEAAGPHGARTTELVGVDDIGLPSGIQPEDVAGLQQGKLDPSAMADASASAPRASAGPGSGNDKAAPSDLQSARTTELVGIDDIGLPAGIQPEDVKPSGQDGMDQPAATGGAQHGGAPSPVRVNAGQDLSPGDEAAPGTVGTGDDVCPVCAGSGKNASGGACPNCRGTGIVTEGIGGG
ncbi:hypothetical protein [Noviherbaspirillum suwonense]|uniref:Chaperone protein DnaJ n=1 Tax=Noviherbaspirillum suwonense TaxID=1224511 RepID=A0ABY1PV33_9BURK|nr:hypothetical protein [Noviherbaspirillum suwonense]SMP49846.1 hypothetical protein SAMN06295970_102334 [Noviherbaspirillum suwonense]